MGQVPQWGQFTSRVSVSIIIITAPDPGIHESATNGILGSSGTVRDRREAASDGIVIIVAPRISPPCGARTFECAEFGARKSTARPLPIRRQTELEKLETSAFSAVFSRLSARIVAVLNEDLLLLLSAH